MWILAPIFAYVNLSIYSIEKSYILKLAFQIVLHLHMDVTYMIICTLMVRSNRVNAEILVMFLHIHLSYFQLLRLECVYFIFYRFGCIWIGIWIHKEQQMSIFFALDILAAGYSYRNEIWMKQQCYWVIYFLDLLFWFHEKQDLDVIGVELFILLENIRLLWMKWNIFVDKQVDVTWIVRMNMYVRDVFILEGMKGLWGSILSCRIFL